MNDNDLIKAFRPIISSLLSMNGVNDCPVIAANQPTRQGVQLNKAIYFTKIADKRYGFVKRSDMLNAEGSLFTHTETQPYETTFQVNALSIQSPDDSNGITASDLVNLVSSIMQSDYAREELRKIGVSILRITDVRNPYFLDDKDRFEASPSFDFTLLYYRTLVMDVGVVTTYEHAIKSV